MQIMDLIGQRRGYTATAVYSGWLHFINLRDLRLHPEGSPVTGLADAYFFNGINTTGGFKDIVPLFNVGGWRQCYYALAEVKVIFTATMVRRRLMDHGHCFDIVTKLERPGKDVQVVEVIPLPPPPEPTFID